MTKERFQTVDYMTPFWENSLTFMIQKPEENNLEVYLYPFEVCSRLVLVYVKIMCIGNSLERKRICQ